MRRFWRSGDSTSKRVLDVLEFFHSRLWKSIVQWVALVKFRMNDRSGDGTGSFEVKIRSKTAKFTNIIIARFRESRYLVRESEVFIKNKTKIASWVRSNQWAGINFGKLLWEADKKKFSFRRVELRVETINIIRVWTSGDMIANSVLSAALRLVQFLFYYLQWWVRICRSLFFRFLALQEQH